MKSEFLDFPLIFRFSDRMNNIFGDMSEDMDTVRKKTLSFLENGKFYAVVVFTICGD